MYSLREQGNTAMTNGGITLAEPPPMDDPWPIVLAAQEIRSVKSLTLLSFLEHLRAVPLIAQIAGSNHAARLQDHLPWQRRRIELKPQEALLILFFDVGIVNQALDCSYRHVRRRMNLVETRNKAAKPASGILK